MKLRNVFTILLLLVATVTMADTMTAEPDSVEEEIIFYDEGGYFVKKGIYWEEHRDRLKSEIWATYTEDGEDDNYYFISNNLSEVAIPKTAENDFYLKNEDGEYEVIYRQTGVKYVYSDGYFIFKDNVWIHYRDDKWEAHCHLSLDSEEDNFYIISNAEEAYAIPKVPGDIIYKLENGERKPME